MRLLQPTLLPIAGLGLAGCEGMSPTHQNVGIGALGGAAIGGVGGYLYDQSQQSRRSYY